MRLLDTNTQLPIPTPAGLYDLNPVEFKEYLVRTNTYYYGRPSEDFSIIEANRIALEQDADYILLEDLS